MCKVLCPLLFVLFFLFASCTNPEITNDATTGDGSGGGDGNNGYNNPNSGISRVLTFSHNSGLYSQPFNLTLSAPAGSTVYYSTDGSDPLPANIGKEYVFINIIESSSVTISVKNRKGQPNILATKENMRQMYAQEGDLWDEGPNNIYIPNNYFPTDAQVPKATVIRAWAKYPDGKESAVITKTYFIGDNLANYENHPIFSFVTDPKNLVDKDIGIMVRGEGNSWKGEKGGNPYNFERETIEWERPAYMELFAGSTGSRTVALSTGVGIRVHGDTSSAQPQKSLNVYFREEYGIKNLQNYNLIPGAFKADGKTPITKYKNFILRNGSEDVDRCKFRDVFIQDLLRDRNFDTQAGIPCIVYLNGEYWGPYNLMEKYSDNLYEYKYGVNKTNVVAYKDGAITEGDEINDKALFRDMMENIVDNHIDMSDPDNYNDFCKFFDIDNFIDYFAAEIYINNEDWPGSNYRAWRTRNVEPGNPWGDTKWRWQMYDTDLSMGMETEGSLTGMNSENTFYKLLYGYQSDAGNSKVFKALLANEGFCRQFVNTMMDLYNVHFNSSNYGLKLDNYAAVYRSLMGDNTNGYFARFGYPYFYENGIGWDSVYQDTLVELRKYLSDIGPAMVNAYLPMYFGSSGIKNIGISAGGLRDVTLSAAGAPIKINTLTPNPGWTGKYYSGNPVIVTAIVPAGRTFDGWTVTPASGTASAANPSSLTTTVNFTGNVTIMAKYK